MAVIPLTFWALTLGCWTFCIVRGDRYGRLGALLNIGAALATAIVTWPGASWEGGSGSTLAVDVGYYAALHWLAVRSHRYWPIWIAGFQLASCLALTAPFFLSDLSPSLVAGLEAFWAIPITLVMMIGIEKDRKTDL